MKGPFYLSLIAVLVWQAAANIPDALDALGKGIKKDISDIKTPIDETIAAVGEVQCSHVKKLIGVDYEHASGAQEPDLNKLTLNFISRDLTVELNLTKAPELLPKARGYNVRAPLIIYIHGFIDDPHGPNFGPVSEAFQKIGEYNILGLDASSLIRFLYLRSTTYVRFVGERLGAVLAAVVKEGQKPESIHLIGHSLGAHIAGFTGKQFTELTGSKVGRISGLDPAGPCFTAVMPDLRLKNTDADFVDAIHTDDGVYGINEVVGHVDFYPNGGRQQPNCLTQVCSHLLVNRFYAESITNPEAFLGRPCVDYDAFKNNKCSGDDLQKMGYFTDTKTRGTYFLMTNDESPYGRGKEGATYEKSNEGILSKVNEGVVDTIGDVGSKILG